MSNVYEQIKKEKKRRQVAKLVDTVWGKVKAEWLEPTERDIMEKVKSLKDGYTPIKGKDYFTKKEIQEFKESVKPVSVETVYSVPASTSTLIKDIQITNNGATDCYISVWIVPSGDSAGDENVLIYQFSVPANDFLHWSGFQMISSAGDTIQAVAETADQITLTISGVEIT